jgi:SAM-dependent MidA family methyltransferase
MSRVPAEDISAQLAQIIVDATQSAGGWLGFDEFMAKALYTPGLGYYANDSRKIGTMPASGSDFVTSPEMTPLFGRTLARQVAQALQVTQTDEVWEFGAGSGALALQVLEALGDQVKRYTIVDLSGSLRLRQQALLHKFGDKVRWVDALPPEMRGVVLGNEVLDAMPVKLLARVQGVWHERGVSAQEIPQTTARPELVEGFSNIENDRLQQAQSERHFTWEDRPTDLRPPLEIEGPHDYLTEIHPQAEAFIRTLADHLVQGAAFFIDYGFPESEYYHPQRHMGTVMCHRAHLADPEPLVDVGLKDITAHVNFTGIALAGQDAGLEVLGYCTQARFLMSSGLLDLLAQADLQERVNAQKLILEHEMGELFKVIGFYKGEPWEAIGFAQGDRTHTL